MEEINVVPLSSFFFLRAMGALVRRSLLRETPIPQLLLLPTQDREISDALATDSTYSKKGLKYKLKVFVYLKVHLNAVDFNTFRIHKKGWKMLEICLSPWKKIPSYGMVKPRDFSFRASRGGSEKKKACVAERSFMCAS